VIFRRKAKNEDIEATELTGTEDAAVEAADSERGRQRGAARRRSVRLQ
jgi:hypothetical protein